MHLCEPGLSYSGKKKGKVKFRNAEEARKHRELEANWKELEKKWKVEPVSKKRKVVEPLVYDLSTPVGRTNTKHIKSRGQVNGIAPLKTVQFYTGNNIKAISQMAKSNAVPVFNNEHIIEIARMRR